MRAYPLFLFDSIRNVEVFYIEFDAGVLHELETQLGDRFIRVHRAYLVGQQRTRTISEQANTHQDRLFADYG